MNRVQFLSAIEGFLKRRRWKATNFGKVTMNDTNFVFELRRGRAVNLVTVVHVIRWIAEKDAQLDADAAAAKCLYHREVADAGESGEVSEQKLPVAIDDAGDKGAVKAEGAGQV